MSKNGLALMLGVLGLHWVFNVFIVRLCTACAVPLFLEAELRDKEEVGKWKVWLGAKEKRKCRRQSSLGLVRGGPRRVDWVGQ